MTEFKAIIKAQEPNFKNKKTLHLVIDDEYFEVAKLGLCNNKPGDALHVCVSNWHNVKFKTALMNTTFHLLLNILWRSGVCSDANRDHLRERIKREFGVMLTIPTGPESAFTTNKSWSQYKIDEGYKLISDLIDYMIEMFLECGHHDKLFDKLVAKWCEYNKEKE